MSKKELNFNAAFEDLEDLNDDVISDEEEQKENNTKADNKNENEDNETQDKNNTDNDVSNNMWDKEEDDCYKTTFVIDSKTEENYLQCRRTFLKKLKTRLTKQDALEIGLLLLKNLDSDIFDYVRQNYTPDDNVIAAIKDLIENGT